jgi:Uma2 family endonuclease
MAAVPQVPLTPEQYLEIERAAEFKSEYYNGRMYAMSGASRTHVLVTSNLTRELGNALKGGPCLVYASDLRVSTGKLYTYPDVAVVCGKETFSDNRQDTLVNPTVIVEVLSPSTEAYDRGLKFSLYWSIESLREYVLVWQARPQVEVFRRQAGGTWLMEASVGLDARCRFESLGCELPLAEIYANVTFEPPETPSERPSPDG